jgi:hypothetical protein
LTAKELKRLEAFVGSEDANTVKFQTWRFWDRYHYQVEITDADLQEIRRQFEAVSETVKTALPEVVDETAASIVNRLDRTWQSYRRRERKDAAKFRLRLEKRWGEALSGLEMLVVICREMGQQVNSVERDDETLNRPFTVDVVTRLHARACQVASEILTLLEAGFADGAFARWRTLHELSVIALFVSKHGEPVARRYCQYQTVQSYFAARQHREYEKRAGLHPIPEDEMTRLEMDYLALLKREGPSFEKDFGWAMNVLDRKKLTLHDIEKDLEVDHLRPYHRTASYAVHAQPLGTFYRLGLVDESNTLLAGPSNFGLAEAGQNAALSLARVTCAVLKLSEMTTDVAIYIHIISRVSQAAEGAFARIQAELKKEEIDKHRSEGLEA